VRGVLCAQCVAFFMTAPDPGWTVLYVFTGAESQPANRHARSFALKDAQYNDDYQILDKPIAYRLPLYATTFVKGTALCSIHAVEAMK
jgi:hypothetical protein